jgi:hypothetical protein
MSEWGQRRARRNARDAARELAQRRAEIDDFDEFLRAMRSSFARAISPEEDGRPVGVEPASAHRRPGNGVT